MGCGQKQECCKACQFQSRCPGFQRVNRNIEKSGRMLEIGLSKRRFCRGCNSCRLLLGESAPR